MTTPPDPTAQWQARYAAGHYVYGTEPTFLRVVATGLDPGDALCLADGEGRNGVFLAERGHRVTAVDPSANGVAKARTLAQARGVALTAVVGDLAVCSSSRPTRPPRSAVAPAAPSRRSWR